MDGKRIKVLVVDDSAIFREVISKGISSDPCIEVVATASDPFDALEKIVRHRPDIMTCDVEMPKMNGIDFIRRLTPRYPLPVIVISSVNGIVFDALNAGAIDFVAKPDMGSVKNVETFILDMIEKIKIAAEAKVVPTARGKAAPADKGMVAPMIGGKAVPVAGGKAAPVDKGEIAPADRGMDAPIAGGKVTPVTGGKVDLSAREKISPVVRGKVDSTAGERVSPAARGKINENAADKIYSGTKKIIAIGASTGGTEAIHSILSQLPESIPGIVIVQHIPPVFSRMFSERLNTSTNLSVKEAENGDYIERGRVLVAPGDQHVRIVRVGDRYKVTTYAGEKVNGHCPSVDVLFESVAKECGENAIGVILTGMGYDGAKGLLSMRKNGARTIGQDESSSVVYGMPRVAFNIGAVEKQAALDKIPQIICSLL